MAPPVARLGLFLFNGFMHRVAFLLDGFNLYHSIKSAEARLGVPLRWIDYHRLCTRYLGLAGGGAASPSLANITYFSALATHLNDPGVLARHRSLLDVMEDQGINVVLGNFKRKRVLCKNCHTPFDAFEEKETDVNIAVSLVSLTLNDDCETVVLVSGDTDLVAAVKRVKLLGPGKRVVIGFPYDRANKHFRTVADFCFTIPANAYQACQLPNVVALGSGRTISKPATW